MVSRADYTTGLPMLINSEYPFMDSTYYPISRKLALDVYYPQKTPSKIVAELPTCKIIKKEKSEAKPLNYSGGLNLHNLIWMALIIFGVWYLWNMLSDYGSCPYGDDTFEVSEMVFFPDF